MTQYAVGGTYTYNETDYTISDIAYKTSYYNENNEEIKDNKNQIAAAYYASQKGQELAKDNVSIYSFALIDSVTDNVRAAMGDTNLDVSEYVSSASPVKKQLILNSRFHLSLLILNLGLAMQRSFCYNKCR